MCSEGYDTKLYVFSMTGIFTRSPEVFTTKMIDSIITLLHNQTKYEEKKTKKASGKNMDDSDSDDDEDYDSDLDMDDDSENLYDETKSDANMSMESFKSELQKADEFDAFKRSIHYFKEKYFIIYI
jgi:hypothetical protein